MSVQEICERCEEPIEEGDEESRGPLVVCGVCAEVIDDHLDDHDEAEEGEVCPLCESSSVWRSLDGEYLCCDRCLGVEPTTPTLTVREALARIDSILALNTARDVDMALRAYQAELSAARFG